MEINQEKLSSYLSARFFFFEGYLFATCFEKPDSNKLHQLRVDEKKDKYQIERFYNYFSLKEICPSVEEQRNIALQLWNQWRAFFNDHFPDQCLVIDIQDHDLEVTIYVYERQEPRL